MVLYINKKTNFQLYTIKVIFLHFYYLFLLCIYKIIYFISLERDLCIPHCCSHIPIQGNKIIFISFLRDHINK